jgi:hypothetical protein
LLLTDTSISLPTSGSWPTSGHLNPKKPSSQAQNLSTSSKQMTKPTELQLCQLYRDWWKDSYGTTPNSQATVVAAAFASHVLATLEKQEANE